MARLLAARLGSFAIVLLLSGCAKASSEADSLAASTSPTVAPDGDTGGISGRVIDDEMKVVPGALVAAGGPTQGETATDEAGTFSFGGLTPGSYIVQVARLGYETAAKKAQVVAGETAQVNIMLQPIAISVARSDLFLADGYLGVEGSVPGAFLRLNPTGDDKRTFTYEVGKDAVSAVNAITWQSTAPATAKRLDLQLYLGAKKCTSACTLLNRTMKPPPAVLQNDQLQDAIQGETKFGVMTFFGLAPCWFVSNGTDVQSCVNHPDALVQVAYQQKIQVATAIFYLEAAAPNFNPLPK